MKVVKLLLILAVIGALGALGFIYTGFYPIGADDPHFRPVYWAMETLRERSIAARSGNIEVPPLDDSQMLLAGGADYNDMCAGCHMKPGKMESDLTIGLYPKPPNLAMTPDAHGNGGEHHDHGDQRSSAARETALLRKTANGWRITHVQWSSQNHEPSAAPAQSDSTPGHRHE